MGLTDMILMRSTIDFYLIDGVRILTIVFTANVIAHYGYSFESIIIYPIK